jgi:hypothetical protein
MAPCPFFTAQSSPGNFEGVMTLDHGDNPIHLPVDIRIQGRRASSNHNLQAGVFPPDPPDEPSGIGIGLVGDRACVDHTDLGIRSRHRRICAESFQLLAHSFRIVLVGFTTEGPE